MSVKFGLLALLSEGHAYGYVLRARFEEVTGGSWPLNIGQVYTTLSRLERDGLVAGAGTDGEGRVMYCLTDAGRTELAGWWAAPVERTDRPRDELAIKIALAVTTPGVEASAVLQTQRAATMRSLQDLTRLKRHRGQADGGLGSAPARDDSLPWRLVLESMVFAAEAEIRWLDYCESTLLRARGESGSGSVGGATAVAGSAAIAAGSAAADDPALVARAAGHAGATSPTVASPTAVTPSAEIAASGKRHP